ncbi:SURF1 family protein [Brachybacterium sp. NBEC-018]|uniref:SURF1 family cytochrome oxidase biogenesis protein n=1 Tax=Brachybacterium sp. NBEC-018 TaxID=2996004 RepID=UPI00217545B6|nr:SURF1 family cytochrome oxidase biogenesis protein [Brachybacterium sp. NBEC-018]UVY82936.1 SURF1 family protein [Brachybacterium sp. NBEC-018]
MSGRSPRSRIILSRDTLVGLLIVLLCAAICVGLGLWQYGRFETKRDAAAVIAENYSADPVPLAEALPDPAQPLAASERWRVVEMTGSYCTDPGCVLYVRNRPLNSQVGFWQLVPFTAEDGTALLVVRGWVPAQETASQPLDPPAVPTGTTTVTVRMRPAEGTVDRQDPPGQVQTVTPEAIAGKLPADVGESLVTGAYGELAAEDPEAARPQALESPDTSLGPHLSYAFQWWIFALFFPAALVYRTRRLIQDAESEQAVPADAAPAGSRGAHEGEDGDGAEPAASQDGSDGGTGSAEAAGEAGSPAPPSSRREHRPVTAEHDRRRRARRRSHDEEEEDALIDQQR